MGHNDHLGTTGSFRLAIAMMQSNAPSESIHHVKRHLLAGRAGRRTSICRTPQLSIATAANGF